MSEVEVVDGEAEEIGTDIELQRTAMSLVPAHDPKEFISKVSEIAKALNQVIEDRHLYKQIGQKKHVLYEGWTFLGSMLGAWGQAVFAVEEWTREYKDPETGQVIGWEARVIARTADGREVGAAESMCTRKEIRWDKADDYAIRSMAQTRAASKALRQPLGFIVQLAGYETTPMEELSEDTASGTNKVAKGPAPLAQPTSWDELKELLDYKDKEATYELFLRFGTSARVYLYEDKDLTRKQKEDLFKIAAGAALILREQVDPAKFPPPSEEEIAQAWATQLEGAVLAPAAP